MSPGAGDADRGEHASRDSLVVGLAQSFSDRHRNGERPTLDEYVARYPELAAEIRELFPVLCVLEDLGPQAPDQAHAEHDGGRASLKRLGEYRIIREIGRGGMGVVYEAEQESLKRRVALKVLPFQSLQDELQLERFRREAQAAARLHHTNIVPVFGVGEDGGVHYYVMQFIRGQTLAQVMQEVRRLRAAERAAAPDLLDGEEFSAASVARTLVEGDRDPPPAAPVSGDAPRAGDSTSSLGGNSRGVYFLSVARIGLQVAEALAYAHNEGILHRDIKPSNLLLDLRGTVWVTDFGLAKVQDSGELTASGGVVGTIRYMAPERFAGAGDVRSDVYSLGITLYEMLTLRPAFAASDRAEVMRDVTGREPAHPRRLDAAIPRDLETVVLKAIAKEPRDRYAGAASLAEDLRRFIHREPVTARRASAPERIWRWAQRNPALATSTALIALLLVALAAGGVLSAAWQRAALDQAQVRLVQAKLEEGRASRLSRELGGRARSLAALREAVTPETASRVRSEIIGALSLVDLEEEFRRDSSSRRVFVDEFLERAAVALPDGGIEIFDGAEGQTAIARLAGSGRRVNYILLGPGGRYLAAHLQGLGGDALALWEIDGQRRLFETAIYPDLPLAAFDGANQRFAYLDRGGSIVICALPSGTETHRIEKKISPSALSFDPFGRRLAAAGWGFNGSTVVVFEIDTGKVVVRLHHPHATRLAAWHPSGRRLAVACEDFKVYIWDIDSGTRLRALEGHSAEVTGVAFSHGGRYLASASWDNRTLLWEADAGELLTEAGGSFTAFSRDDRRLGFDQGSQYANIWRLSGGECFRTLDAPMVGKGPRDFDVSADGEWLGAACAGSGVRIWSLTSPDEPHEITAGEVWSVRFQRDGEAFWTAADEGLFRWPVSRVAETNAWSFGPPERITDQSSMSVSLTRDGRRVATVADSEGRRHIQVLDVGREPEAIGNWPHPFADRCDISPSGRWVVSSTFHGSDVRVWNVADGSLVRTFEVGTAQACFSPDDRRLAMSWDAWVAVYETGSWEERFKIVKDTADQLGGAVGFTADGRFLAAGLSRSVIGLLRVEDGSVVARFEARNSRVQIPSVSMMDVNQGFLAVSSSTQKVLVWDLRALRTELRAMGLDWSVHEPLTEQPSGDAPRVRIDSGSLIPGSLSPKERAIRSNRVLDTLSRRVEIDPGVEAFNARAAAFEKVRDWPSALIDLDRVVDAVPDDFQVLSRRAVVHQHLGNREALFKDIDRVIALCQDRMEDPKGATAEVRSAFLTALRVRASYRSEAGVAEVTHALADWKEVLAQAPNDPEASRRIAWLWILERCAASAGEPISSSDGDAELALACAQMTHAAEPENGIFARDLGAMYYHLGRFDEARPLLKKAWRLNRQLFSAHFHLAMVEHRQGDPVEARRIFDRAASEGRKEFPEGSAIRPFFETILACTQRALAQPPPERRP